MLAPTHCCCCPLARDEIKCCQLSVNARHIQAKTQCASLYLAHPNTVHGWAPKNTTTSQIAQPDCCLYGKWWPTMPAGTSPCWRCDAPTASLAYRAASCVATSPPKHVTGAPATLCLHFGHTVSTRSPVSPLSVSSAVSEVSRSSAVSQSRRGLGAEAAAAVRQGNAHRSVHAGRRNESIRKQLDTAASCCTARTGK
jgi:hypothetical protein